MPIIRSQHTWKDSDHVAHLLAWPDDCMVQWGGEGVVLGKASYTTAFFEAFPHGGGFIRGEGPTIKDAEANAFTKFKREAACDHVWGRRGYTNGGTICLKCKGFKTTMKEILILGSWREPIRAMELQMAIDGSLQPRPDDEALKYRRKTFLRLRRAGIDIPAPEGTRPDDCLFTQSPYALACQEAVFSFMHAHGGADALESGETPLGTLEGFFQTSSMMIISRRYAQWAAAKEDGASAAP